jgi:hypothetical protein
MATKRTGPPKGWLEARQKKALAANIRGSRSTLAKAKRLISADQYKRASDELAVAEELLQRGTTLAGEARVTSARAIMLERVTERIEAERSARIAKKAAAKSAEVRTANAAAKKKAGGKKPAKKPNPAS